MPGVALPLSLLVPGVGSIYGGRTAKGVWLLIAYILSWPLAIVVIGFILAPVVAIIAMITGYKDAVRWNAVDGIIS